MDMKVTRIKNSSYTSRRNHNIYIIICTCAYMTCMHSLKCIEACLRTLHDHTINLSIIAIVLSAHGRLSQRMDLRQLVTLSISSFVLLGKVRKQS